MFKEFNAVVTTISLYPTPTTACGANTQTVNVSESGYSGTFTIKSNSSTVTVSQPDASGNFTVTGGTNTPGTTVSVTATDAQNHVGTLTVNFNAVCLP